VSDGVSTLTIYGYFLAGLPVLFFPLGGRRGGSDLVWFMVLLCSTPILGFGVVRVSVGGRIYGTPMGRKGVWDDGEVSSEILHIFQNRIFEEKKTHGVYGTNEEIISIHHYLSPVSPNPSLNDCPHRLPLPTQKKQTHIARTP